MTAPVIQFKRGLLANLPGLRAGEPGFTTDSYDLYVGLTSETSTNKFFGSHRYWKKETASTGSGVNLVEANTGSDYITLAAPASVGAAVTYYFPATQGAVSSVLTNDGNGNLTWASGSESPIFTGIATFSGTTDNTLGNADTGAVQIDGGLGVNKNVTIGAGLSVAGDSHFIGTATFYGGQINLGDSNTDDIVFGGEIKSNIVPTDDGSYDLGIPGKRWRDINASGTAIVGALTCNNGALFTGSVQINTNLNVNGNVTVGGTTISLKAADIFIENKDIILGYTTSITPNDDTANHAGVAIASTVGTPLANFDASGINTLPSTYKQMMWFKSGTLGFSTDAFAFNYGVAIGTTTMANGVRLAVGSGITMSDTSISATTFYGSVVGNVSSADQVKTVTASDTNANYYVTFVNSHNGSATNETVYTDDGIYYNPGTNTFTTQYGYFTGNVTVDGDVRINGNDIQASDGNTNITLTSNTLTTFAGDIKVAGNNIKSSTGANALSLSGSDVTVNGNLYINGSTTQINTAALTVEDRTIDLGIVNGAAPSADTTWDLGVLFNYYSSGAAKKSAVVWEHNDSRFKFASVLSSDTDGSNNNTPQLTVTTFAPIEIGSLWVNDCAGQSQVISCTGTTRYLENITIDAGTF